LAAVLTKMSGKEGAGGIYRTHPPTGERLAKVQALAPAAEPGAKDQARTARFQKMSL
jgi:predicted Zn-dependent protease